MRCWNVTPRSISKNLATEATIQEIVLVMRTTASPPPNHLSHATASRGSCAGLLHAPRFSLSVDGKPTHRGRIVLRQDNLSFD